MRAFVTFVVAAQAVSAQAPAPPCSQYDPTHALETPCNIELVNSTRYQIRVYGTPSGQSFSTARVSAPSWSRATQVGFQLNFAYIEGANKASKKIPMTAPVVTRNPSGDEANWLVSFFTPQSIYPTGADVSVSRRTRARGRRHHLSPLIFTLPTPHLREKAPVPTNGNMTIEDIPLSTFAVVEFGGEANEADYKLASTLLKDALVADGRMLAPSEDEWAEAWCGYDAPNDLFNRHNEAWVKILLA